MRNRGSLGLSSMHRTNPSRVAMIWALGHTLIATFRILMLVVVPCKIPSGEVEMTILGSP